MMGKTSFYLKYYFKDTCYARKPENNLAKLTLRACAIQRSLQIYWQHEY